MTGPLLPASDFALLAMLPDPSKVGDMKRGEILEQLFSTLYGHFKRDPDVLVGGNGYLCRDNTDPSSWVKMDCVVASRVIPKAIIRRNGYMIDEVGKPPDFVLEIVPTILNDTDMLVADVFGEIRPDDVRQDYDHSRNLELYAAYGVKEYWRLAADGDPQQDGPLVGFRLENGSYDPITITRQEDGEIRGYSAALNLYLCWDGDQLRWWQVTGGRRLETFAEVADARDAALKERDAEKALRVEAEYRCFVADERVRRLEEMVRSLRLERYGGLPFC